jgi:hypothetical protein
VDLFDPEERERLRAFAQTCEDSEAGYADGLADALLLALDLIENLIPVLAVLKDYEFPAHRKWTPWEVRASIAHSALSSPEHEESR